MEENKDRTWGEALGIEMSDKWMEEACKEAETFMIGKADEFSELATSFLMKFHMGIVPMIGSIPPLGEAYADASKLHFIIGYSLGLMKGGERVVKRKDEVDKLDKLMEGGEDGKPNT